MESDGFLKRISERACLAGIGLTPALAAGLEAYLQLLTRWNRRMNLTALGLEPVTNQAIDRLLIEPLAATRLLAHAAKWFDLGSGGGSPAIPLKLANSGVQLVMVESKERKAAFLMEATRALKLEHATVETGRIETIAARHLMAGSVDVITVRAVRVDPILFGSVRALLRPHGKLVLFGVRTADLALPHDFQVAPDSTSKRHPDKGHPEPVALNWMGP